MKLKIRKTDSILQLLEYVDLYSSSSVTLFFKKDYIEYLSNDLSNISQCYFRLDKSFFSLYDIKKEHKIIIMKDSAKKLRQVIKKNDCELLIGLSDDESFLSVAVCTPYNIKKYNLRTLEEPDYSAMENICIKKKDYDYVKVLIKVSYLKDMIDSLFGDSVRLKVTNKFFNIEETDKILGDNQITLRNNKSKIILGKEKKYISRYNKKYLYDFLLKNRYEECEILFSTDYPLIISCKNENDELIYMLAPLVDDEPINKEDVIEL